MKYTYKAATLLAAHIVFLYFFTGTFGNESATSSLPFVISLVVSVGYSMLGYKAYKKEGTKIAGVLFIALGVIGMLMFALLAFLTAAFSNWS
ncbi:MAG: hypothetical protein RL150_165 [Candidatus Parcubacteria bacterium]|jgi:hypothetical protein